MEVIHAKNYTVYHTCLDAPRNLQKKGLMLYIESRNLTIITVPQYLKQLHACACKDCIAFVDVPFVNN